MPDGVTVHDADRCYEGYTLFAETYLDGVIDDGATGAVHLVDMAGESVHSWEVESSLQSYCRLQPDGSLIYPTRDRSDIGRAGLRKLDPESNVEWYYHCRTDHDFQVLESGNLLIHTLDDHMVPELGSELKRNPYIVEITPEKELVWEWRGESHVEELRDLLDDAAWDHVWGRIEEEFPFDWAHNNTCQVIPPNETHERERDRGVESPRFAPGNIVFSYRSLDVIGVIDRDTGEIVWAWGPGEIDGQHKPHVLENGNVLLFDNGTLRGHSRVIELDPLTETIEWEYTATPEEDFFSPYISGAQRLPNGNTLVCEGSDARLFEVTPDHDVVWEFHNPFHGGDSGSIYRCLRYSPDYVEPLLEA